MNHQSGVHRGFATDPRVKNPKTVELHTNATLFVADGEILGSRATAGQFVLFAHGIELALKSFLHERGKTLKELEGLGHRLDKLVHECEANGLVCSQSDTVDIIARVARSLVKAKLRYDFDFDMPLIDDVRRVACGMLADTEPALPLFYNRAVQRS